ncbi:ATP-binding cassette domain-containing protein [Klebsiella quasipneumoniae]
MSGSAFAVTHHAFSSGAGRTSDGNGSHASTLKSPSYTKSVSWQHYPLIDNISGFDDNPDLEFVMECAKHCNIHDEIMKMAMGYETIVGELGLGISGGQKQRILIARALYRKPSILFMDEATSHLDLKNESVINQSISALSITRIIVAHRPSTIASADRVIDLSQSKSMATA